MIFVSVIIPTMKGREGMLYKLLSTIPDWCETIIVDDEDLLLAAKRNKGAAQAKGHFLLFIDDDNYIENSSIENMIFSFEDKMVGIVGMMACYSTDKNIIADGGSKRNYLTGFTTGLNTNRDRRSILAMDYEVDEVANCFMIPKCFFNSAGKFDEKNFPIDLDEADLCKRFKDGGLKTVICPQAICYHNSITYSHIPDFRRPLNAYFMGRNRVIFQRKHSRFFNYCVYLVLFMPVFVLFYCGSLLYRKKPGLCIPFLKGVFDGLSGRRSNKF